MGAWAKKKKKKRQVDRKVIDLLSIRNVKAVRKGDSAFRENAIESIIPLALRTVRSIDGVVVDRGWPVEGRPQPVSAIAIQSVGEVSEEYEGGPRIGCNCADVRPSHGA